MSSYVFRVVNDAVGEEKNFRSFDRKLFFGVTCRAYILKFEETRKRILSKILFEKIFRLEERCETLRSHRSTPRSMYTYDDDMTHEREGGNCWL